MNLSKSKYTKGVICKKLLWLSIYKEEEQDNTNNESVLDNGNKVGELARNLFNEYKLIEYNTNYEEMINNTNKELYNNTKIICEASFKYNNNFCSVDILKNDKDGAEIYEVKSSTKILDIYIDDISYQTWILKNNGLNVKKCYIVYVNSNYIKNKELNINEYFIIEDVTNRINLDKVDNNIKEYINIINSNKEPNIDLSISCHKPYPCPYFKYCTRKLPIPNIFDIGWSYRFDKKIELYKNNIISYKDILDNGGINNKVDTQISYNLYDLKPKINKKVIKELLDSISFPLYFLDFESYQDSIPKIDNTKPYQQICFQYSLHYYLEENGELLHKEFLSDDYDNNPMYGLCKQLCQDIPLNSCILVYNQAFEKTRLAEMSRLFPEFHDHLLNIKDNIIDLYPPFKNQDIYYKDMGGSASIKKVLPALFPNDSSLDYHSLNQVHKGDEASQAFLSLKDLSQEEEKELRDNLLKYCQLDTYAMVKIYEKLKELVEEI